MTQSSAQGTRLDTQRTIRAPRGTQLRAKSWLTEAPLRMLMNNLDPDVAEHPHALVVYGGTAARRVTGSALTKSSKCWSASKMTRLYWCNRVNRLGFSPPTKMRHAC